MANTKTAEQKAAHAKAERDRRAKAKAAASEKAGARTEKALDRARARYGAKAVAKILDLYTSDLTGSQIDVAALGSDTPTRERDGKKITTGYASFIVYRAAGLPLDQEGAGGRREAELDFRSVS